MVMRRSCEDLVKCGECVGGVCVFLGWRGWRGVEEGAW